MEISCFGGTFASDKKKKGFYEPQFETRAAKKRRLWKKKEKMKSWCLNIASIAIKQWATARCVNFWIRRWENFRWRVWLATDVAYVIGILIKQLDKELGTCHDNEMTRSLFIVPSFRLTYRRFVWMLEGWEGVEKSLDNDCLRTRGQTQPRLGRDATASAPRCDRVCTEARSHAGLGSPRVSRARFVDKPTIHALHGGAERGVGLRFQNMGAVQLVNWFLKIWVVVLFCSSYKLGERHPLLPVFSCRCKKKLIVSRQPIFTNLKSNTMKNSAKVHEILKTCKP